MTAAGGTPAAYNRIDPRALATFWRVCETGSITAAARVLNLSQPSVSSTIALLEQRLGVVLFTRSRSGIVLTREGEVLRQRAETMVRLLEAASNEVSHAARGVAGPLRIGGTPGALVSLLPAAVASLEEVVGPFALSVIERPDSQLADHLRSGAIDLAFVTTEIEACPADLVEVTAARDPFALIVGCRHDDLEDLVSLRDVADLPWVLPEAQGAFRRQVDALFLNAGVPVPQNVIRCDSLLTTKAIVRHSDRVTVLPRTVAGAELTVGVLRAVTVREATFERSVGIRYLAQQELPPLGRALLDILTSA
ncbi:MAG: LysR family transcriptional regulator [Novosphingobium sp. 17-62-19]|uniref:LysR family transcriptional regulator n=1 Tax=Novosphingobium sp. 17-62-19 TaxID=1970406 RepID=UPI000BC5B9DD|nr:LysR family transcriptional regulator [Novosphingobium sp. 17-62-19]OYX92123.1 MAG: LysR family transcriptional regulator [Novosphingobium sp. 35-62-5]OZA17139.1 MAG: LysR family transcriptional regulator [Novosphingobium sp. 17-62-19]HQS97466.1 LysR family transcriptional regulator [Novosphingobium sp.]